MTSIPKQFQATPPPAFVKAVEEIYVTFSGAHPYYQCLTADGNTFLELQDNIQGYVAATAVNYNQGNFGYRPPGVANQIRPLAVILKKLPEKLRDPVKFLIPCGFSELKCKALADLGASINLMPLSVWKQLGLPELISIRMTLELANRESCTPAGIARDVFVLVGKVTFPANFVIVDYKSDLRDFLEDLFATNHQSGNLTFSSHSALTSPKVKDDIFDSEGGNVLIKQLLDLDSTKDLPPPHNINPLSGSTTSSSPNHLLKDHDPINDMDSILEDSIDEDNLADLDDNLVDTMLEMFTDEHALDYSSPPLYDEYDDDLYEVESETKYVYDDPFESNREKIKESKLLIDELDPLRTSDFLPSPKYSLRISPRLMLCLRPTTRTRIYRILKTRAHGFVLRLPDLHILSFILPGHLAARLGYAETKVATWDDLAFKLIILGGNMKHRNFKKRSSVVGI
uniref:Reverse transcriptase domain-containing protein n=1 Tax=Tanacetum cinerariifolium TaxID=118510 RepID=A0A6L2MBA2_TANCI|nr:reverse transcriptase domain-containing protein [Tanacetum cinerariifolium]